MRTDHDHRGFTLTELMMTIANPQYFTYIETANWQGAVTNSQVTDDIAELRHAPIFAVLLPHFWKWLSQRLHSVVQVTTGTAP
ncbi:prepilin-type N-terminal cleavage/methylation domain-containing protein [Acidithiobacillus ferrivorans]|nr:prepilin-type N-terminal cleavage/methylation domain-containing protein [Acidithiobacillus ferrivorans]